jgi:hypothetical protein
VNSLGAIAIPFLSLMASLTFLALAGISWDRIGIELWIACQRFSSEAAFQVLGEAHKR